MAIFWADAPARPDSSGPIQRVWTCPANALPYHLRTLAAPIGVYLHWNDNQRRTSPCQGDDCPLCKAGSKQQWKSYAPALLWHHLQKSWEPVVCEITEAAHADLLEALDADVEWTGLVFVLQRVGNRTSKVSARLADQQIETPPLPPFPIRPTLERMWNLRPLAIRSKPAKNQDEPAILPFKREAR